MNKRSRLVLSFLLGFLILSLHSFGQAEVRDSVKTGIYITSIHDIDFKAKEYTIDFWLWLKYKNREFNFVENLEIPQAKSVTKSFSTIDSSGKEVYLLMKIQCIMKDSWAIDNFPFDHQTLRLSIENSQFDSKALIFKPDTLGKQFDPRFTLRGWDVDSLKISAGTKLYETAFGDTSVAKPHTEYSNFKVRVGISRNAMGIFWKMFLGMYVAFLIAFMCFYIHTDSIDSRFGLSVGSLFAVIGNKYIIDASLPETTTFTLVDTLHGITLLFILAVIVSTAYSLKLIKNDKLTKANRFDRISSLVLLSTYIALNFLFILEAIYG
ncbi:ligand-gated ion channel [Pedobacter sp. PWIIR3]